MTWSALLLFDLLSQNEVPHFETDIIPLFTQVGCNAGSCHGAAAGRGGLHLSLFAGDPSADYETLVFDLEGRRINLAKPEESLLLLKPSGKIKHGGKKVLQEGEEKILLHWIAAGAPRGPSKKLLSYRVIASPQFLEEPGKITLRAFARFENEMEKEVTRNTLFTSADPASAKVVSQGSAQILSRGFHDFTTRYLDRVESVRVTVPLSKVGSGSALGATNNFIDASIAQTLESLRLPLSAAAPDEVFLRRIRLDLTGRLPTQEEIKGYLEDPAKDKKNRLVEKLLKSKDFVDFWTLRFARLLQVRPSPNETEGLNAYVAWLKQGLENNKPLDQWGRELLLAKGDSHEVGPANFHRSINDARGEAELVSRVFMGVRLQCANCHNHPMDRWTQDDYHGLAAIFAKLERGRVVRMGQRGEVTNPRTGEPAHERIPGQRNLQEGDHLAAFSNWVVSKENPAFAKAMVNRVWRWMFGRGLVEPIDDLRPTNPATHPALLQQLADDFFQHGHDLRHTLRLIALSNAYGRSGEPVPGNEIDTLYYSRFPSRGLEPEVLADAIADVTGVPLSFPNQPKGTRAVTLYDPIAPAPSLDILGRCNRTNACQDGATAAGLAARLHLLNGDLLNERISSSQGWLMKSIQLGESDKNIIEDLFLRSLGRNPTPKEWTKWQKRFSNEKSPRKEYLEDFFWALLNSQEFTTNH